MDKYTGKLEMRSEDGGLEMMRMEDVVVRVIHKDQERTSKTFYSLACPTMMVGRACE